MANFLSMGAGCGILEVDFLGEIFGGAVGAHIVRPPFFGRFPLTNKAATQGRPYGRGSWPGASGPFLNGPYRAMPVRRGDSRIARPAIAPSPSKAPAQASLLEGGGCPKGRRRECAPRQRS